MLFLLERFAVSRILREQEKNQSLSSLSVRGRPDRRLRRRIRSSPRAECMCPLEAPQTDTVLPNPCVLSRSVEDRTQDRTPALEFRVPRRQSRLPLACDWNRAHIHAQWRFPQFLEAALQPEQASPPPPKCRRQHKYHFVGSGRRSRGLAPDEWTLQMARFPCDPTSSVSEMRCDE